jgi:hypothetical protein
VDFLHLYNLFLGLALPVGLLPCPPGHIIRCICSTSIIRRPGLPPLRLPISCRRCSRSHACFLISRSIAWPSVTFQARPVRRDQCQEQPCPHAACVSVIADRLPLVLPSHLSDTVALQANSHMSVSKCRPSLQSHPTTPVLEEVGL